MPPYAASKPSNITRGPGWHFLNIGRRIERSVQMVDLLRSIIVPIDPENWPSLEMLLEVADSSITYRSRYFTVLQAAPVVDLLMNDEANPRSLAFQLKDLARHCASLSGMPSGSGWPVLKQRQMEAAAARLLHADVELLCEGEQEATVPNWIAFSETWGPPCPHSLKPSPILTSVTRKWSARREMNETRSCKEIVTDRSAAEWRDLRFSPPSLTQGKGSETCSIVSATKPSTTM